MITSPAFRGKRYAVLGLARSGLATVAALAASGAQVVAWDDREEARQALRTSHPAVGITDFPKSDSLAGYDAIIVSPGVPLNRHPLKARADADRVPVIGDIELFAQARASLPPHKVVGITGTNGKSTTTALIHHIVATAGIPARLGGNIGLPILGQDPLPVGGIYVLELSSYQIDLTYSLDCDVSVLLNITPDHLDRYDGFAGYVASKARLFAMQSPHNWAVIVGDDDRTRRIAAVEYARRGAPAEWALVHAVEPSRQHDWPALQGPHNAENAAAAIAAARALGISDALIEQGLRTYPGLPHRMERVLERDGLLFVNDSKATNPTSTAPALAAYPAIHWILGGIAKTDDLDACAPHFDHVRAAYTIGEAGPMFARLMRAAGKPVTESGTLEAAVRAAAAAARPGEVVMLSPACASFDQFRDFEARGDAFRAAVEAL
ncbi:UDP-N-acetylmuramoyl-L-alanine--D-glutamate ligase [Sphingomonas oleivorans]|uniref:UDP-N-acetylmuramoylalanine--D-glutamate ligase n=1 Tax=Sphingomonas oleivorans TaxID=1735121 RepID=A0A2T5FYB0_9SPHN|nr:UDP-N-acetylmuramoyl-L-alanine--D-glutamate ligase [Sphingomonas oleivorans]PTQ11474.1 UDP-N-acetylmuramoyl-L-alanine--D-glutamate ligase [Sphingomonas oleivorans]